MSASHSIGLAVRGNGRVILRRRYDVLSSASTTSTPTTLTSASSPLRASTRPPSSSCLFGSSSSQWLSGLSTYNNDLIITRISWDPYSQYSKRCAHPQQHTKTNNRYFHTTSSKCSDNLLGYSPMARPLPKSSASTTTTTTSPNNKEGGAIWGVDSNTAGGGVWAQTSAKRDKLNELLTELREAQSSSKEALSDTYVPNLDEAATGEEKLDLELADGLKVLACWVDNGGGGGIMASSSAGSEGGNVEQKSTEAMNQLFRFLDTATSSSLAASSDDDAGVDEKSEATTTSDDKVSGNLDREWSQWKFEASMKEAIRILSTGLPPDPPKKPVAGKVDISSPLCYIREFMEVKNGNASPTDNSSAETGNSNNILEIENKEIQQQIEKLNQITTKAFSSSIQLYRTLLLRAVAQTMLDHWSTLTAVTSGDVDRAAVAKKVMSPQRSTIDAKRIRKVFEAYANGNNEDMVRSWWELLDADGDGMIDEEEMNHAVDLAIRPVHLALGQLLGIALEVCPARRIGLGEKMEKDAWFLGSELDNDVKIVIPDPSSVGGKDSNAAMTNTLSWRKRRAELRARRALTKTFQGTLTNHFRDQVETPHRLRCIYAWAEKSHQDNKVDSILVDASEEWGAASSIVGRKRYVELMPKISYEEFQEVQRKHFPHLDRVGEEILTSFKEDLWVLQGKGRQNKELRRDCFLFLLGVSLLDVGIGMV